MIEERAERISKVEGKGKMDVYSKPSGISLKTRGRGGGNKITR